MLNLVTGIDRARCIPLVLLLLAVAACSPATPIASAPPGGPSERPAASGAGASATPGATMATDAEVEALRQAALDSVSDGTVRMVYTLQFEGASTIPDGVYLRGRGQTSFGQPRRAHLTAELQREPISGYEMILDDRKLYLKGDVVSQIVPEERWLLVDLESDHRMTPQFATLAAGQNDSSLALLYVLGAIGDVRYGPGESIDGSDTRRYDLNVSLDEALERAPDAAREALAGNVAELKRGGIGSTVAAQVWVGEAGRILRSRYDFLLGPSDPGGHLIGTYGFSDYGAPIDVSAPPEEDVLRLEDAMAD